MSFVNQLFKGFVKSAVNQIGRDGGRVVSNRVYKNAHAIKIQGVGGYSTSGETISFIQQASVEILSKDGEATRFESIEQVPPIWVKENLKPQYLSDSIWLYPFVILGLFAVPVIGEVFLLFKIITNLFATKLTYKGKQIIPKMVQDRRRREGFRQEGFIELPISIKLPIEGARWLFVAKGIIWTILLVSVIFAHYKIINFFLN